MYSLEIDKMFYVRNIFTLSHYQIFTLHFHIEPFSNFQIYFYV